MKDLVAAQISRVDLVIANYFGISTLVLVVRAFYFICTIAILAARLLPPLRQRFLSYGARAQHGPISKDTAGSRTSSKLLDRFALVTVPHRFFTHFYLLSLIMSSASMIWLYRQQPYLETSSIRSGQRALLCALLMVVQSIRRLLECVYFFNTSISRMWIGHYIFGLCFYFFTNLATWIETVYSSPHCSSSDTNSNRSMSLQTICGLVIFATASYIQFTAHAHLANLRKYSVPDHWTFRRVIAPHYTSECAIYLALALVGASSTLSVNWTLAFVVILTTVNLGITAEGTKSWMLEKFRDRQGDIELKWCLLPGIW